MDILNILSNFMDNQKVMNQLNKSVGADSQKVEKAVQLGIPMLIEALNRNVSNTEGAQSLTKALEQHTDDKVDDLFNFFNSVDKKDGAKILEHIFPNKNDLIKKNLSKTTGLKQEQVGSLLMQLAPLLLGLLGNQKKEQNLDVNGIINLTSGLSKNLQQTGNGNIFSVATKLLDANKDGSIVDDLFNIFFKKKRN